MPRRSRRRTTVRRTRPTPAARRYGMRSVARAGIEPATRGFSVRPIRGYAACFEVVSSVFGVRCDTYVMGDPNAGLLVSRRRVALCNAGQLLVVVRLDDYSESLAAAVSRCHHTAKVTSEPVAKEEGHPRRERVHPLGRCEARGAVMASPRALASASWIPVPAATRPVRRSPQKSPQVRPLGR
jgi:hypothetical protein